MGRGGQVGGLQAAGQPRFLFNGQWITGMDQLNAAAHLEKDPKEELECIRRVVDDKAAIDKLVATLFSQYGGGSREIAPQNVMGLAVSVGAEVGCSTKASLRAGAGKNFSRCMF